MNTEECLQISLASTVYVQERRVIELNHLAESGLIIKSYNILSWKSPTRFIESKSQDNPQNYIMCLKALSHKKTVKIVPNIMLALPTRMQLTFFSKEKWEMRL